MKRSVRPYPRRIARSRLDRGWTQRELARNAGVSLSSVERCEAATATRVDRRVLRQIVKALEKESLEQERETLDHLVLQYQCLDLEQGDDPRKWIALSREYDRRSDFDRAYQLAQMIVDVVSAPEHPAFGEARIHLVTVLDHLDDFDTALEVANELIELKERRGRRDTDLMSMRYHRAIVNRRIGEELLARTRSITGSVRVYLEKAKREFEAVRRARQSKAKHKVGARHHLGVIDLLFGRDQNAIDTFSACLQDRRKADGDDPDDPAARVRHAYECRRLGQAEALRFLHEQEPERKDRYRNAAMAWFDQAERLAAGNRRTLAEIKYDRTAFAFV